MSSTQVPLSQFRREIVHFVKNNIFKSINFEHSTCRPHGLNLPFIFMGGGDFSLGLLRWDIVHMGQNIKSGTTSGLTSQAFEFG